jgi:hypothetical protein
VKFMWGVFACNELLCERFGMVETPNCACCGVVETPWHVVGECGHAKAVEIRVDWAKRMWELVQAEISRDGQARCGYRRSECTAADVKRGNLERKASY